MTEADGAALRAAPARRARGRVLLVATEGVTDPSAYAAALGQAGIGSSASAP